MVGLILAIAVSWLAAPHTPDETPRGTFAVHCGTLYPGDGPALHGVWLVVRDGRIDSIVEGKAPDDMPILDASGKVVMPGIVAADSVLADLRTTDYHVTPDFVALDGFDFDREFRRALSGGVTTAYLGMDTDRLVSGQGSVVKLFGDDPIARTLDESNALQITLGAESTRAPTLFEPTLSPSDDDPLVPARRQYPSARISQLAVLRDLFDRAARGESTALSTMVEHRYDPAALREVVSGELPLRIAAREAADIVRALQFAKRLGVRLTLDDPFEVDRIAGRIAKSGAHVVVRIPVALSAPNQGGEDRTDESPRNELSNAAVLARAGVPVALAPERNADMADFLFIAGIAIRHGLEPEVALRAITTDAAATIGVADRVGSLRPGHDADFLVLSGEPFAVGTLVEKTFVDGVPAFERTFETDMLAIRADRIITAAGPVLRDATVIVADGKIKAVGEELAVPYGARVVDLGDAVVTPGFINSFTSAGLSGDGVGVPSGTAAQKIDEIIRHDDPVFEEALEAGLTTLLVAGSDGSSVSGRVTAVKTGASDDESAILKEIAALRVVHDEIGPDSTKPLADLMSRGKKYIESWEKYEKALADWKAGKVKKAEESESSAKPAEGDPISGRWECELGGLPMPFAVEVVMKLKLDGTAVTGSVEVSIDGNKLPQEGTIENGKFENGKLTGSAKLMGNSADLEATVEADKLTGTLSVMGQQATIEGERVEASASEDDDEDDKPKAPKVDESLEPVRAWVEKKIPLVVKSDRAPAVQAVLEFFRKEEMPFVMTGVSDAIETPEILGADAPPIVLGPAIVSHERGDLVNAAARLADRGAELAFGTGDTAGAKYLPLHVAHAIRWGLDPQAALEALTIDAARMFKLDDRVGSLERGKDADLVVFSGNPFELTSRVLLVVCNGRIAYDARGTRSER
ncbi:MAG: amidohydrolase family protein [Planctomycetes bacterium]|nr:amidohydrolase family protein [Planctomycetota bacterium]